MLRIIHYHNYFGQISAAAELKLAQVVRDTAERIRNDAAANAPVDTAALQSSLYVSNDQGSDYAAHAADAQKLRNNSNRPGSPAMPVPEVTPDRPMQAFVGSAVQHGLYNELGTSRMAARPFLVPAVANAEQQFHQDIEDALK
jgi:HK97 gp10 family phage protein